jgi:hypothetical protein
MQLNLNYQDAIILRDNGINALKQSLGEDQTRKFLALFNYYDVSEDSAELQVRDYTEWRRTQAFYNDYDLDEVFELAAKREKERGNNIQTTPSKT